MHYFSIFFKKFSNALIFRGFGRKTQSVEKSFVFTNEILKFLGNFEKILKIVDENSIEKLNFYFYFGKFVT